MPILVAGASKPLGAEIALALAASGHEVIATRRKPSLQDQRLLAAGIVLETLDLTDLVSVRRIGQRVSRAVLVPILSVSAPAAQVLARAGVERGVVFSSNNVAIVGADPVYDALRAAEGDVLAGAPGWAVLRPTMIYGYPGDGNLSRLLAMTARWPVLLVPGRASSAQQPIYYGDLARIAALLAEGRWLHSGVTALGGPDIVTHGELLEAARRATGRRPAVIRLPVGPIRQGARLAGMTGLSLPLSPAQLARIDLDKSAVDPAPVPAGLAPSVGLDEGLSRLVREMALVR